eukprot:84157_1
MNALYITSNLLFYQVNNHHSVHSICEPLSKDILYNLRSMWHPYLVMRIPASINEGRIFEPQINGEFVDCCRYFVRENDVKRNNGYKTRNDVTKQKTKRINTGNPVQAKAE